MELDNVTIVHYDTPAIITLDDGRRIEVWRGMWRPCSGGGWRAEQELTQFLPQLSPPASSPALHI